MITKGVSLYTWKDMKSCHCHTATGGLRPHVEAVFDLLEPDYTETQLLDMILAELRQ